MNIIVGNAISFIGAIFLSASCVAKTKKRVCILQLFQCIVITASQIAFGKGAGAVAMSFAGVRNLLIMGSRYNFFAMLTLSVLIFIFGVYFNSFGLIGLMPPLASVMYTVALYYVRDVRRLKFFLSILLFTWIVYSALIYDIFGVISNIVAQVLNVTTLSKMKKTDKTDA